VDFGPKHFAQHPDRQVGRWYGRSARGSGKMPCVPRQLRLVPQPDLFTAATRETKVGVENALRYLTLVPGGY
jgi:hypothetical protein